MTTGKTIALTRQTFVGKIMSLLFNMLSRLVITFLPRSKHLLISWLQSPSAVILEPRKIKSATVSIVSPSKVIREMQIKTKMKHHYTPNKIAKIKILTTPNVGKDMEQVEASNVAGKSKKKKKSKTTLEQSNSPS